MRGGVMRWSSRAVPALRVLILGSWAAGYGADVTLIRTGENLRPDYRKANGGYLFEFTKMADPRIMDKKLYHYITCVKNSNGGILYQQVVDGWDGMVLKMQLDGHLCLGNENSNIFYFNKVIGGVGGCNLKLQDDGKLAIKIQNFNHAIWTR